MICWSSSMAVELRGSILGDDAPMNDIVSVKHHHLFERSCLSCAVTWSSPAIPAELRGHDGFAASNGVFHLTSESVHHGAKGRVIWLRRAKFWCLAPPVNKWYHCCIVSRSVLSYVRPVLLFDNMVLSDQENLGQHTMPHCENNTSEVNTLIVRELFWSLFYGRWHLLFGTRNVFLRFYWSQHKPGGNLVSRWARMNDHHLNSSPDSYMAFPPWSVITFSRTRTLRSISYTRWATDVWGSNSLQFHLWNWCKSQWLLYIVYGPQLLKVPSVVFNISTDKGTKTTGRSQSLRGTRPKVIVAATSTITCN